jgi:hypothetical protein
VTCDCVHEVGDLCRVGPSLHDEVIAALDRYRESIKPEQHYASQQFAMQDALAYATVFLVMPILERREK